MQIQKAAVIGHPIGHTMSPFIHRRLFELEGIPFSYQVMDVPDLKEAMGELRQLDCFNITIPHKSTILPYLDELGEKARRFGSVNTVHRVKDQLIGNTTDGPGCRKALENHGVSFSGNLLLLGNGGAARALAFEAAQESGKVGLTIACRAQSMEKALSLGRELEEYAGDLGNRFFSVEVLSYDQLEQGESTYDLLLNATSVGMTPHAENSPVTGQVVARCQAVFDAVYNPGETKLLQLARTCGAKAIGGMEMLVYQAVAAHEIWYGTHFSREDLKTLCLDAQEELYRLFPGNGQGEEEKTHATS